MKYILAIFLVSTSLLFTTTVKAESVDIVIPENAIQISKYVISIDGKEYSNDNGIWYLDGIPTELPKKPEIEQPTNAVTEPIIIDKEEPSNIPTEPTEKEQPKAEPKIPTKIEEKDDQENVADIPEPITEKEDNSQVTDIPETTQEKVEQENASNIPTKLEEKEVKKEVTNIPNVRQEKEQHSQVTNIPKASDTKVVAQPLSSSPDNTLPPTGDDSTLALVVTGIIFLVVGLVALAYITIGAVFIRVITSVLFGGRKK
ncbi:LPXTG cell wall anchor domain-containing protein [Listeria phage LP-083-1]|uniref:LPXTG cell wall anchor domain-containing protein n=1 Tax=Listeria phage LP-083-1 TaxID=1458854 RepID=A0A059T5J3_9CAUD|nr:LPXTG cell wall anchor domain-containing protein [Listeria phage LP-083-1]